MIARWTDFCEHKNSIEDSLENENPRGRTKPSNNSYIVNNNVSHASRRPATNCWPALRRDVETTPEDVRRRPTTPPYCYIHSSLKICRNFLWIPHWRIFAKFQLRYSLDRKKRRCYSVAFAGFLSDESSQMLHLAIDNFSVKVDLCNPEQYTSDANINDINIISYISALCHFNYEMFPIMKLKIN